MTASVDATASAGAPTRRAPDFFIVGHPKSGTSALFQMLSAHPQLHMPRKEPHYFVPEVRSARDARFANGIGDYLELFAEARPDQLIGEATTAYLWSEHAAERIAEVQPGARIIAVLREPADFLRSLHMQFIRSNAEDERDLRRAIALDEERRAGRQIPRNSTRPAQLVYAEHVRYVEQLRRYHEAFGPDQVLVLIYEDFRADNEGTLRRVLSFLGVDENVALETIEANPTVAVRSPRLYSAVRSLYLGRDAGSGALKRSIKSVTSQRARRRVMRGMRGMQYEAPPAADEQLMRELRLRFKPEVVALSDYLDRDLVSFWGYDQL
jgi:hypothetical protein